MANAELVEGSKSQPGSDLAAEQARPLELAADVTVVSAADTFTRPEMTVDQMRGLATSLAERAIAESSTPGTSGLSPQ
jgi:hypothetical protein